MTIVRVLILVVAAVTVPTFASAQTFTNYDTFVGPLNPALWNGFDSNSNTALISNLETQRAIVRPDPTIANGFLQLGLKTAHPGTGSDSGEAGQGRQRLRVARTDILTGTATVTGFRTKVTILSTRATPCPTSTDATRAMAQVSFFFFNTGGSTGVGDATGDVFAGFNVEQSSTAGRIIGAFLGHCTNATCSTLVTDKFQTFTRRWTPGVPVPLQVVWDHTNDLFMYTAGTEQHVLTYGDVPLTDALPPVVDTRDLQVRNVLPNCSTPVLASATARYDFLQIATEANFP